MGRPNRGTGSAGPKKPNPPINRPQYGNGGKKNELDNKIIESAITFYFKDEDSGSTKTWNYFKTAN